MKTENEICECGHERKYHPRDQGCFYDGMTKASDIIFVNLDDVDCPCKKFTPKNQSPQKKPKVFIKIKRKPEKDCKPEEYLVYDKRGQVLGQIYYYKRWRKFVFSVESIFDKDNWFDNNCLREIADFMDKLPKEKN